MIETYQPAALGIDKIRRRWLDIDSMAGVGIDPVIENIPTEIWDEVGGRKNVTDGITLFNQRIIDATVPYAVDYKVNSNFFQSTAARAALTNTFEYLKSAYPEVIRVCDGKFADVGHTAEQLADYVFGELDADAVLLNPYLGKDAVEPFTSWKDKLVVLCVNTSNDSAHEIQDMPQRDGMPLWRHILLRCMDDWNTNGNIIPVLSATHVANLEGIRAAIGDTPVLLAGVGTQGGSLVDAVPAMLDSQRYGLMISSSRAILYPERGEDESIEDAAIKAVSNLRDAINDAKRTSL